MLRGVAAACLGLCLSAQSVCGFEVGDDSGIPGVDLAVRAMVKWDPDGNGPEPEWLVVAGTFLQIGPKRFDGIAAYDGTHWRPLGTRAPGAVASVAYECLTVLNGELVVGGTFQSIDGIAAANVARWDGTSWRPFGSGIASTVYCTTIHNGELFAYGILSGIQRWTGTAWSSVGVLTAGGIVRVMSSFQGELVAGGSFGQVSGVNCRSIARWTGTNWIQVGAGLMVGTTNTGSVDGLLVWNGNLVVTGLFSSPLGGAAQNVVQWTGSGWLPLDSLAQRPGRCFLGSSGPHVVVPGAVLELTGGLWTQVGDGFVANTSTGVPADGLVFRGSTVVSGSFSAAGPRPMSGLAVFENGLWEPLVPAVVGVVRSMAEYAGGLAVSCWLNTGSAPYHGYVLYFDGSTWRRLASSPTLGATWLHVHGGQLYVGGSFASLQGVAVSNIAVWSGSTWAPVGGGVDAYVAMLTSYRGELVAVGNFLNAGGTPASRIARWNGNAWQPLRGGVDGLLILVAPVGDRLAVSGAFQNVDGSPMSRVAQWDGTAWSPMENGLRSTPIAIADFHGVPHAAGFTGLVAGPGGNSRVGRWNGTSWDAIHPFPNDTIWSVLAYGGDLYFSGFFTQVGTQPTAGFAAFDGSTWTGGFTALDRSEFRPLATYGQSLLVAATASLPNNQRTRGFTTWTCNSMRFGSGCGVPPFRQLDAAPPRIATTTSYAAEDGLANSFVLFVLGLTDESYLGAPLPLPLDPLGAAGCHAYCDDVFVTLTLSDATGRTSGAVSVPADPYFVGVPYFTQFYCFDGVSLRSSDALRQVIVP